MKKVTCTGLVCIMATWLTWAAIPAKPIPPKLVNDNASMLSASETRHLEDMLVAYNDSTTTQICIVTVNDLEGQDILQAAYEIGEQWGVGQEKFSNGVVLLIKNKTEDSGGEMAIATGYGTEGALTDALCRRIIEQDMVPSFRDGDYYNGIQQAVLHIQAILSGEDYGPADENGLTTLDIIIIILVVIVLPLILGVMLTRYAKKHPEQFNNHDNDSNSGFWIGGGGDSHSGGGFSDSSGFGGFGGGHFGGGGARGSW